MLVIPGGILHFYQRNRAKSTSPNVSWVEISPNVSEVVRPTVSKVDWQIELEVKKYGSQSYEKASVSFKKKNVNFIKMAEQVEMSA